MHENVDLKHCNHHKAFIRYFNDMDDTYENKGEYNPNKKNAKYLLYLMICFLTCLMTK